VETGDESFCTDDENECPSFLGKSISDKDLDKIPELDEKSS